MNTQQRFGETIECVAPGMYMVRVYGGWPDDERVERHFQRALETNDHFVIYNRVASPELGSGARFLVVRRSD